MKEATLYDIQELLVDEMQKIYLNNREFGVTRRLVRVINRKKDQINDILIDGGYNVEENLPLQLYKISEGENIFRDKLGLDYGDNAQNYIKENFGIRSGLENKKLKRIEEKKEIQNKENFLNELDLDFFFPGKGEEYKEIINKLYNKEEQILNSYVLIKEMNNILSVIINKQKKFSKTENDIEVASEKEKFIENLEFFFETMILDKKITFSSSGDWSDELNKSKIKNHLLRKIEYFELESRFCEDKNELFIEYGIEKQNLEAAQMIIYNHTNLVEYGKNYNEFCKIVDINNLTLYKELSYDIVTKPNFAKEFVESIDIEKIHELGKTINENNMSFLKELLNNNIGSLVDNINSGILLEIVKREE